ncbi:MAG: tyrosine-type recombinase/integrase [Candidatus Saccharibacteria bacterium]
MEREYSISIFLDSRRELKNHKYPVKLRVFTPFPRKQKLYQTDFEFSEKEFESIWETTKPRNEVKTKRAELQAVLDKAEKTAKELEIFTFEAFENVLLQKSGEPENVFFQYDSIIAQYKANNQIGTASSYDLSQKAIKNFLKETTGKVPAVLRFREINPQWLNRFETYMTTQGKSKTTTGIYLRTLRAIFNTAVASGVIKQSLYPFGRRKYEIPHPRAVKKALSRAQLKKLFETVPRTPEQAKAKDFFFFLFNTAGMNIKDMARLRYENLQGDTLIYMREKTKRTSKSNQTPVVVYLNDYSKEFISKYGNPEIKPKNFIFDIYKPEMTEKEQFIKSQNFTRVINLAIQKLAKENDLPEEISTYWSRHSFATNAIRSGATLEQVSEALNHKNSTTTKGYFAGFETDAMRELTANLMNFNDLKD